MEELYFLAMASFFPSQRAAVSRDGAYSFSELGSPVKEEGRRTWEVLRSKRRESVALVNTHKDLRIRAVVQVSM